MSHVRSQSIYAMQSHRFECDLHEKPSSSRFYMQSRLSLYFSLSFCVPIKTNTYDAQLFGETKDSFRTNGVQTQTHSKRENCRIFMCMAQFQPTPFLFDSNKLLFGVTHMEPSSKLMLFAPRNWVKPFQATSKKAQLNPQKLSVLSADSAMTPIYLLGNSNWPETWSNYSKWIKNPHQMLRLISFQRCPRQIKSLYFCSICCNSFVSVAQTHERKRGRIESPRKRCSILLVRWVRWPVLRLLNR